MELFAKKDSDLSSLVNLTLGQGHSKSNWLVHAFCPTIP